MTGDRSPPELQVQGEGQALALRERALLHHGGAAGTWGNLGLWPTPDYATAAAALARTVGEAAGLAPGQRVLSAGCGAGDELALWVEGFGVAEAVGLEADPALLAAGREAARRFGGQVRAEGGEMFAPTPIKSPLDKRWDAVVSVDAAYHFSPRSRWLQGAFEALRPGGRLAFTDLLLEAEPPPPGPGGRGVAGGAKRLAAGLVLRLAARGAGLDRREWVCGAAALDRLRAAGFVEVGCRRLDEGVLGGFAAFAARQAAALGPAARDRAWRRVAGTARAIPWCRAAGLGYALLWGTRPA